MTLNPSCIEGITLRPLEVLEAYSRLGSVQAAADEIGIAKATAERHLSTLYGWMDFGPEITGRALMAFRTCLERGMIRW